MGGWCLERALQVFVVALGLRLVYTFGPSRTGGYDSHTRRYGCRSRQRRCLKLLSHAWKPVRAQGQTRQPKPPGHPSGPKPWSI